MKRLLSLLLSGIAGLPVFGELGVDVAVVPQAPWNRMVDIWVTLSGAADSTEYKVRLVAHYTGCPADGLEARALQTEPVITGSGRHRLVWDLGKDAPGLVADDFAVTAEVTPFAATDALYRVIDLSGGPEATSYPSRYAFAAPDLSDDTCRTTELWLKRVPAGTFTMGSGTGSGASIAAHTVRLTKAFYMAIFPTTQAQWAQVMGDWPSFFENADCRAVRPVESVSFARIRGHNGWYDSKASVGTDTFVGRLRAKSTWAGLELPSNAQWEYVCRAGTTGRFYFDGEEKDVVRYARTTLSNSATDDRNQDLTKGTSKVGSYPANPWGFYDFYGNVCQLVPDGAKSANWSGMTFPDLTEDPRWAFDEDKGVVFSGIRCGSAWNENAGQVNSSLRRWTQYLNKDGDRGFGFRICINAD